MLTDRASLSVDEETSRNRYAEYDVEPIDLRDDEEKETSEKWRKLRDDEKKETNEKWRKQKKKDLRDDKEKETNEKSRLKDDKEKETNEKWRKQREKVDEKLTLEKLREAYLHRDEFALKNILHVIDTNYDELNERPEIKKAETALDILTHARELRAACDRKNIADIRKCWKNIKEKKLEEYLANELREAKYRIEDIKLRNAKEKLPRRTVDMDRAAMTELRRYHNPPPGVHPVMQGVLLLLGEDEASTENWSSIQRLLMPYGNTSLYRKIMDFNMTTVHRELAARSKQMLEACDLERMGKTCPIVEMLYVWARGIIDDMEIAEKDAAAAAAKGNDKWEPAKPAKIDRQRALLGRRLNQDPQMDRNYYHALATTKRITPTRPKQPLNQSYYRRRENQGERIPGSYDDHDFTSRSSSEYAEEYC